nr:unnamed protein product [Callosobruchus analis]
MEWNAPPTWNAPTESRLKNCSYENLILNHVDINIRSIYDLSGEYKPKDCVPLIKTALIVPYRNRATHLKIFLNYMHHFLQNQRIHYQILIVDQNDTLPFNRAKMLNYGAKVAIEMDYSCLILHDVDLIPISTGNIYGCSKMPRHMSSSVDTFRYNLPYLTLFGGAVAILSSQYKQVNGMSNKFYGWGAEDDDFYRRLITNGIIPYRFSPDVSRYTMLPHMKEMASSERFTVLTQVKEHHKLDGLSSLSDNIVIKPKNLYTHIIAS